MIALRGKIAIAATFAAFALSMALDEMLGFSEPSRPPDHTLAARISLVCTWMLPVGLLLGPAAIVKTNKNSFYEVRKKGRRLLPLSCSAGGLALFVNQWLNWGPYTGEDFSMFQGWEFGVALLLVWWGLIFVPIGTRDL